MFRRDRARPCAVCEWRRGDLYLGFRRPTRLACECRCFDRAFVRVDGSEVLDDLEPAASGLGDVHVQAQVVLAGDHCGWAAGAVFDLGVVEGGDDVVVGRASPPP